MKSNPWKRWALIVLLAVGTIPTFWYQHAGGLPASAHSPAPPDARVQPKIVIWVYNYAQVPSQTMADTENEVGRILGRAGVSADWIKCPVSAAEVRANRACQDAMSATELALEILPRFKPTPDSQADTYFGLAQVFTDGQFGHYAYVFYDQVQESILRGPASVSQVLAHTAAHEFGHLLLRSMAHSCAGLMRAQWDRSDLERASQGRLNFSGREAELLRAEVLVRMDKSKTLSAAQYGVAKTRFSTAPKGRSDRTRPALGSRHFRIVAQRLTDLE